MSKYKIRINIFTYKDYLVNADSDSEAMDKAQTKAWREFNKLPISIDWETEIEELEEV